MGCRLTDEMIDRFYLDRDDSFLRSHLLICNDCRKTIDMISALDLVSFPHEPPHTLDKRILGYAYGRLRKNLCYIREVVLTFSMAYAVLLFAFIPAKKDHIWYDVDSKVSSIEYEVDSFENEILLYPDYLLDHYLDISL